MWKQNILNHKILPHGFILQIPPQKILKFMSSAIRGKCEHNRGVQVTQSVPFYIVGSAWQYCLHFFYFHLVSVKNIFFGVCSAACGILVPQPGIKLASSTVKGQNLNHFTIRDVSFSISSCCMWAQTPSCSLAPEKRVDVGSKVWLTLSTVSLGLHWWQEIWWALI